MCGSMAQPTTLRENRSMTTARYSQPVAVRMYVMSPAPSSVGLSGIELAFEHVVRHGQVTVPPPLNVDSSHISNKWGLKA